MSTAEQTRAAGWYWVNDNGWRVAQWVTLPNATNGWWCLSGEEGGLSDHAFTEIDERKIEKAP